MKAVLRHPAFCLWALLCLLGSALFLVTLLPRAVMFPAGATVGLALLIPVLIVGTCFFRWLHPIRSRPWPCALAMVLWGFTAAFGLAFVANTAFLGILSKTAGLTFTERWGAAIAAPIDEETVKLAGVVLLALMAPWAIRGPLDGFGYGALVGVGFQIVEDFLYIFNTIVLTGAVHPVSAAAGSCLVRVVFGAWWSHWTFTGVSGAAFGYLAGRTDRPLGVRVAVALGGYALAVAMHAWFDTPFLGGDGLQAVVKGLPLPVIAVVVYRTVRRGRLRRFREAVSREVAREVLRPGEDRYLTCRSRRRWERRRMPDARSRSFLSRLRTAQLDLIDHNLAGAERDPIVVQRLRLDVVILRALLVHALARHGIRPDRDGRHDGRHDGQRSGRHDGQRGQGRPSTPSRLPPRP